MGKVSKNRTKFRTSSNISFGYLLSITLFLVSGAFLRAQTTDPVTLLRQVPRVQFPANPSSVISAPQKPRAETTPSEPSFSTGNPQGSASSSTADDAADPSGNASAQPTTRPVRPAETASRSRSLLSRIPLVGRLVPDSRPSVSPSESEPTPTPPVLLPPPGETDSTPAISSPSVPSSSGSPNFYSQPPVSMTPPAGGQPLAPQSPALAPAPPKTISPPSLPSDESSQQNAQQLGAHQLTESAPTPPRRDSVAEQGSSISESSMMPSPIGGSPASLSSTPAVKVTYPRLTSADFVVPTAELEPNEAARNEYLVALTAAREGKAAEAASAFRAFAQRYATSRLAPRALFMAALLDTEPQALAEDVALLRKFFPRSDYLTELELRGVIAPAATLAQPSQRQPVATSVPPTPDPRTTATQLREEVERDYRDRNYAAAIAKLESSPLTSQEPSLLEILAQCQVAMGDNVAAVATIEKILANFPAYERRKNVRLTYGLLLEDAGKYERAIAEYRKLIEEVSDSVEAQTARTRIQQLDQLTR